MDKVNFPTTPLGRLKLFFTFFDSRWEDITKANFAKIVYQDFSAGLIVAMTAIPMAMGFAMAMGMRPEHGIIAGALACLVGRTFGGSKYQVYGPTAAFIPVIAGLIKDGNAGASSITNYTSLFNSAYLTPNTTTQCFARNSGDTSNTLTLSGSTAYNWAMIGVELDSRGFAPNKIYFLNQSIHRSNSY